jgi:hypothetical protein
LSPPCIVKSSFHKLLKNSNTKMIGNPAGSVFLLHASIRTMRPSGPGRDQGISHRKIHG